MLNGISVGAPAIAAAWEVGLGLFASPNHLYRHDSERGVTFEIPGMTLVIDSVSDTSTPARYLYPRLIEDYAERIFGSQRDESLLHARLRQWKSSGGATVDQVTQVVTLLRDTPETRTAAFSLWQPDQDPQADYPVSPVAGNFRVIAQRTHLHLVARSVDYWVGAIPELLAFARLQQIVADEIGHPSGSLIYHMWSAHVYEDDCLAHLMSGQTP
jgi:hypothetical protein